MSARPLNDDEVLNQMNKMVRTLSYACPYSGQERGALLLECLIPTRIHTGCFYKAGGTGESARNQSKGR